jgi:hypothetical protein
LAVTNAVRGTRPLATLDGKPLGQESAELAARLAAVLEDDQ